MHVAPAITMFAHCEANELTSKHRIAVHGGIGALLSASRHGHLQSDESSHEDVPAHRLHGTWVHRAVQRANH